MRIRTFTYAAAGLTAALLLSSCGSETPGTPSHGGHQMPSAASGSSIGTTTANAADRMFVMMMIPHHEQAIEMSDIILAKQGIDPKIVALATQIKAAQAPEIATMKAWLTEWGMPHDPSAAPHDMGDDGMLSDAEMTALKNASGEQAGQLFLKGMIAHHEGAVAMARPVVDGGQSPEVIALAKAVISTQTAEITTMKGLLK